MTETAAALQVPVEPAVESERKHDFYGSIDDMVADGASEVEYAEVEGFKAGKMIRIGSVNAMDMIEWSDANEAAKKTAGLRLIVKSLVDANGKRIGTNSDIQKLSTMRHNVTERIVKEILKLNGMTVKADADAKKD